MIRGEEKGQTGVKGMRRQACSRQRKESALSHLFLLLPRRHGVGNVA